MFNFFFTFSLLITIFGAIGVFFQRNNLINLFINLEIMLLGVILAFSIFSYFSQISPDGYLMSLIIITLTAAETPIGLSLLVLYYNKFLTTSTIPLQRYVRG